MDKFFPCRNPPPTILCADWSQNTPQIDWLTQMPLSISFSTSMMWKIANQQITICETSKSTPFQLPTSRLYLPKSVLKSSLQKSVRRRLTQSAVSIMLHFLAVDPMTALRRLSVIMVEDVRLKPSFMTVTWLMIACAKDYHLSENQINWILGVVTDLCEDPEAEINVKFHEEDGQPTVRQLIQICQRNLNDKNKVLLTVLLRQSYGGMKCDQNMFHQCTIDWIKRSNNMDNTQIPSIEWTDILPLKKSMIPICGIDYHCYPNIINLVKDQFPQLSHSDIQYAIWECSSKINVRKNQTFPSQCQHVWAIIGSTVKQVQSDYLAH